LIFGNLGGPFLAFRFPIGMMFAIHRGKEIQPLLHGGEHGMLSYHGIPGKPWDK
jgi:hypothetical protein